MALQTVLGDLLLEITTKQNWYSKVFNDDIVQHWKQEFITQSPESADLFDLVVKFAQATAQGSVHKDDCSWQELCNLCDECKVTMRKEIEKNPQEYDVAEEDLENLFEDDDWIFDLELKCDHPKCTCIPPDFDLHKYIEYMPEGVLNKDLCEELKVQIRKMLEQEPIDWHPGSHQQVRDLVHPSMYCYVRGVSKFTDGSTEPPCEEDRRYQWLPSEFKVSAEGQVEIASYINNLNAQKYPQMVPLIQRSFEAFLPSVESVLKKSLRSTNLQVITKIGTIYLDSDKPNYPGGSWHIEGMPYEHIAATCIHYLDVRNISESFLEFRKPVILNEEDPQPSYPQSDSKFSTHHYGIEDDSHFDGQMNRYLGLVKCYNGASIVFPNTLQHKVKEFRLTGTGIGTRTILVFFIIDPSKKVTSTAMVSPQQTVLSPAEAEHHRERLMFHRKFFVSTLNEQIFERPYSLCEH